MFRKVKISLAVAAILLLVAGAAYAQEPRPTPTIDPATVQTPQQGQVDNGSIRGTIYEDKNADGKCGAGDPIVAWIPINFVSDDGKTTLRLQSGENGTYGLVAAGFGTWKVTADPPAPWVVTSKKTIEAFLGSEQRLVLNVDFCIADVKTVKSPVVLPRSGAAIAPELLGAAVLGLAFLLTGLALEWRRQRMNRA